MTARPIPSDLAWRCRYKSVPVDEMLPYVPMHVAVAVQSAAPFADVTIGLDEDMRIYSIAVVHTPDNDIVEKLISAGFVPFTGAYYWSDDQEHELCDKRSDR